MSPEPSAQLQAAVQLHFSGQFDRAQLAYRQILAQSPNDPGATHMLGMLLYQCGNNSAAQPLLVRSLELAGANPDFHHNFALFCRATGRPELAANHLRKAIALSSAYAPAYDSLGLLLEDQGKFAEAQSSFAAAIAAKPDLFDAHLHLGMLLTRTERYGQSVQALREALRLQPQSAAAHIALCSALGKLGEFDESIRHGQAAVRLAPDDPDAHAVLACALGMRGMDDQALAHFHRALQLAPANTDAMTNLAWLMNRSGHCDQAVQLCRQAIAINANNAATWNELAHGLRRTLQVDQAVEAAEHAIRLAPGHVAARINLSAALLEQGNWARSIAIVREAIALQPRTPNLRSSLLLALHYDPNTDRQILFQEHQEFGRMVRAQGLAPHLSRANDRDPSRPLRIGYVSPYFRRHAVACFLEPILRNHDRSNFIISCYSDVRVPDELTVEMKRCVHNWYDVASLTDSELSQLIFSHGQDILVDLTGHIDGSRLLAFATKPAPVQITYLGYQDTTGLDAIDYRLTDAVADPPGLSEAFHVEQLLRLPCFFCYQPPVDAPPVVLAPNERSGTITFGCFNHIAKLNPPILSLWARILTSMPNSRVMILIPSLGVTERMLVQQFQQHGLSPDRLRFVTRRPHGEYLKLYHQIDIALDPFPFSGHTTTCDALWMGVPVVTLAGQTYASRMTASVLTHLGLLELIASSPDEYVHIACELADDRSKLASLRMLLRDRMAQSTITDGPAFTTSLERAYRQAWKSWCGL